MNPIPLTLERFAIVSAEIEKSPTRDAGLARENVSLETWLVTQEFWMKRMAGEAQRGRFAISQRYVTLLAAHRARLNEPASAPSPKPESEAKAAPTTSSFPDPPSPKSLVPDWSPSSVPPDPPHVANLDVNQFAALRAELAVTPEANHAEVHLRFGLDEKLTELEDAYWIDRLAEPRIRNQYRELFSYYRALLGAPPSRG